MNRSEQVNEIFTALAKAQGLIEDASKDSKNPHFKSKYADLASVRDAIRIPLSSNGIAFMQLPRTVAGGVEVETILGHSSGQFVSETLMIPLQQMTAQTIGSATSYAKRYALMGMVGLAASDDDDDGNLASARPVYETKEPPPRTARGPESRQPDPYEGMRMDGNPFDDSDFPADMPSKEPAVSTKAINMGREFRSCRSEADIGRLKLTPEFVGFWKAANGIDRTHVTKEVEKAKAALSDMLAAG